MFVELIFYVCDGCYLMVEPHMLMTTSVTFSIAEALDIYELLE
jgi:hypothetical protein